MALKFFQIPARGCGIIEAELNQFLRGHKVLRTDRRWVEQGDDSFWAICIDYMETSTSAGTAKDGGKSERPRVDYREVLNPDEFDRFSALRDWRKKVAAEDGVPVYAVFTNDHLAQIVQSNAKTKADLERIEGLGENRIQKSGERLLQFLNSGAAADATSGESV